MATIATLAVNISAGTAGLVAGLKKGSSALSSFGASAISAGLQVAKFAAGLGLAAGAAAVGGLALLTKSAMSSIDELAKASDRLGVTTEAMVSLRHAAGLAGVGTEELHGALQKMNLNLQDAAAKGGPVADTLRGLGLDVQKLAASSPDQAFREIADAISKLPTSMDKASAAVDIFGKSGSGLINLLNGGKAALDAASQEAEKLGISLSRVDAAKVEAANDSMSKVGSLIQGVGQTLAIQLAPFVEATANKLVELGANGLQSGGLVTRGFEMMANGIAAAADYVKLFEAGWHLLKATVLAVVGGVLVAIDMVGAGITKLLNLLPGVELEWTNTFSVMADSMANDVLDAVDKAGQAFDSFASGENSRKVGAFFDDIRKKAEEAATAAAKSVESKAGLQEGFASALAQRDQQDKAAQERAKQEEDLQKKIRDTTLQNDPLMAFGERKAELEEMLAGGLSQSVFDKEMNKALDAFKQATGVDESTQGGHTLTSTRMGAEFFAARDTATETDSTILRQILEQLKSQNRSKGVGVQSEYN